MKKLSLLLISVLLLVIARQAAPAERVLQEKERHVINKDLEVMNKDQVAHVIAAAGFPKDVVPVVTCLAAHESNFMPQAVNENANHTLDYGLLQINSVWLKKTGCNTIANKLLNPINNAKCALKIYKTQGLTAWTTYTTYKNECLAYKVDGFDSAQEIANIQ